MDYSKIRLKNERNSHVTKRLNRLNGWNFFRVLYRDNMWRLFAFSIVMLLCIAPIFVMQMLGNMEISGVSQTLPNLNSFGFSTGVWDGVDEYYAQLVAANNLKFGLLSVAVSVLAFIVLSGGFAVIRDAFWTGKLSTVGVFKSIGKGIAANTPYAIVSTIIVAFGVFGIATFCKWLSASILWLAIVLTILLGLVLLLIVTYLLILCSVTVTYKQSLLENLDDSWRLLWMNFLPNLLHVVVALLPIALYFLFSSGIFQLLFLVLMMMFGGMYFPLVWHSFMMRTFALFHPVEPRKKKDVQREEMERQAALNQARQDAKAARQAGKKGKSIAEPAVSKEVEAQADTLADEEALLDEPSAEAHESEDLTEQEPAEKDPYAIDDEV